MSEVAPKLDLSNGALVKKIQAYLAVNPLPENKAQGWPALTQENVPGGFCNAMVTYWFNGVLSNKPKLLSEMLSAVIKWQDGKDNKVEMAIRFLDQIQRPYAYNKQLKQQDTVSVLQELLPTTKIPKNEGFRLTALVNETELRDLLSNIKPLKGAIYIGWGDHVVGCLRDPKEEHFYFYDPSERTDELGAFDEQTITPGAEGEEKKLKKTTSAENRKKYFASDGVSEICEGVDALIEAIRNSQSELGYCAEDEGYIPIDIQVLSPVSFKPGVVEQWLGSFDKNAPLASRFIGDEESPKETTLSLAAQYDNTQTLRWLFDNADESIYVSINRLCQDDGEETLSPFHLLVRNGNTSMVKECLERFKANSNLDSIDGTPLYLAARAGFLPIVEMLLAHGADPNRGCQDGETHFSPLFVAAEFNHLEIAKLLLAKGAVVTEDEKAIADSHQYEAMVALLKSAQTNNVETTGVFSESSGLTLLGNSKKNQGRTLVATPSTEEEEARRQKRVAGKEEETESKDEKNIEETGAFESSHSL